MRQVCSAVSECGPLQLVCRDVRALDEREAEHHTDVKVELHGLRSLILSTLASSVVTLLTLVLTLLLRK